MLRARMGGAHVSSRDRARNEERAGLDPVWLNIEFRAVQLVGAVDDDAIRAGAGHAGAHSVQEVRQVDDFGLARRVLDDGLAFRQDRGHHQILGAGDRDLVENDPGATQPIGVGANIAVLDLHCRTHRPETLDVQVDGARADGAAARQRDVGAPEPAEQWSEDQHGGAHGLDQFIGCRTLFDIGCIDLDPHIFVHPGLDAQASK